MPIDPTRLPTPHDGPDDDDDGLGRADVVDLGHKRLDELPTQIGPYRVLETIGEGGMGVVYRAQQRTPIKRDVVIKLIKLGMDTKLVIARFEAERQALAMMDHPNIAKVFDAGADETGRPYFVMEYVKGQPITEFADAHKLTIEERLRLMQQVCDAIQHAHHKGVVHRDLKPSNVLATTQDGKPFAKVIDFGIAKAMHAQLTDMTVFTQHHQMIGTPEYMSPEQANGSVDVDTRTDVYSLGVLLYELLTGQTPFDTKRLRSAAYDAMVKIIREEDPPKPSARLNTMSGGGTSVPPSAPSPAPPSTLSTLAKSRSTTEREFQREVRGELDWLVMKSMDKDRGRRYATPTELSQDIERYLNGTPVVAVPPSWAYRASKFTRKYKRSIGAAATLVALLCAGIAGTSWQAHRANVNAGLAATQRAAAEDALAVAERERAVAERQRAEALLAAYIANLSLAKSAMENNDWPGARRFLNECPAQLRQWEWRFMMRRASRYDFALPVSSEAIACSPDESRIATATSNGGHASTIHLWSPVDGKLLRSIDVPFETGSIRFSPDGRTVLASDAGAKFDQTVGDYSVSTWDAESGSPTTEFKLGPMDQERGAALRMQGSAVLSPSGRYLARWNVDTVEVWDCPARRQIFAKRGEFALYGSASFAADESSVAFTSKQEIECVDLRSGASRRVFPHGIARPTSFEPQVRLSPTGRYVWLGIGALNQDWTLFDAQTGTVLAKIDNGWADSAPLFTPDESGFVTASNALVGFVRNTPGAGAPEHLLRMAGTASPRFSPDGKLLASNALVMEWPTQRLIAELRGERADREWLSVVVMPQSRRLLIGRELVSVASLENVDQVAYVMTPWMMAADAWRSREVGDQTATPYKLEAGPAGRTVFTHGGRSTTLARAGTTPINVHALSRDGERLAYADGDHVVFIDTASGRELIRLPVLNYSSADENRFPTITKLAFAEQDQWLRIEYDDELVEVWDVRDAGARQSERDTFDATRVWAEKHVATLLAGAEPEQRHLDEVKSDASLTELQRLFALEVITLRKKAVEYRERTRQAQQRLQQIVPTSSTQPAATAQPAK